MLQLYCKIFGSEKNFNYPFNNKLLSNRKELSQKLLVLGSKKQVTYVD
jgi:hypothetical protein